MRLTILMQRSDSARIVAEEAALIRQLITLTGGFDEDDDEPVVEDVIDP